jgi:hypothetical protein
VAREGREHPAAKAIENALRDASRSQSWLGGAVAVEEGNADKPYSQAAVSGWLDNITNQPPARIFAIERALGRKPGTLSRLLGYLPADARNVTTVVDAIDADPLLDDRARFTLRTMYQAEIRR